MIPTQPLLDAMIESRLPAAHADWMRAAAAEIAAGAPAERLASLLSLAGRHAPRGALAPSAAEREEAGRRLAGWSPERWSMLETMRVRLFVGHPGVDGEDFVEVLEECFRYADAGELTALYRSLAHLPRGERFVWRAGEGCRTNMRTVFEAVACDTPYPVRHFGDRAWCQLVLKAVFIEAPLWRVYGLDQRLSPELARMALDLADERRSAGRPVPAELWLCLGAHAGERGLAALEQEMSIPDARSRQAAALALARAGASAKLCELAASEPDPVVRGVAEGALAGRCDQGAFAVLEGSN